MVKNGKPVEIICDKLAWKRGKSGIKIVHAENCNVLIFEKGRVVQSFRASTVGVSDSD